MFNILYIRPWYIVGAYSIYVKWNEYFVYWLTHWGRDKMAAILKWIFFNENVWISIEISLKFVPKGPINNIPALVQIMAWRRLGDKPLSELMVVSLLTHICVTRPQWVIWCCRVGFVYALNVHCDVLPSQYQVQFYVEWNTVWVFESDSVKQQHEIFISCLPISSLYFNI